MNGKWDKASAYLAGGLSCVTFYVTQSLVSGRPPHLATALGLFAAAGGVLAALVMLALSLRPNAQMRALADSGELRMYLAAGAVALGWVCLLELATKLA